MLLLLLLLAALLFAVVPAAARRAGRAHERLTLVRVSPVTVSASGFPRHRTVTVTLRTGGRATRRVRTTGRGSFTVRFPTPIDLCSGWSVSAWLRHGAPVVLRGPHPECAPAMTP